MPARAEIRRDEGIAYGNTGGSAKAGQAASPGRRSTASNAVQYRGAVAAYGAIGGDRTMSNVEHGIVCDNTATSSEGTVLPEAAQGFRDAVSTHSLIVGDCAVA